MIKQVSRNVQRKRRHRRVRKKITGTMERPRLNVFRSNKHIYAQIINDLSGNTMVAASSLDPALRQELGKGSNIEAARKVGALLARRALEAGIEKVVFDRGGYLYHGRVKALAEAARESGLQF
ncbi:MAG TPA: 50S ribosomal protein L18 [Bacillota bacterium]|jgi:large subunit ribosomal protein L18|nr:50S ribosomal protein L18 [Bacillota bacterium]HOB86588.1 50S ribosomal protein L18 [Bacillota bacterium]HOP68303.1 50S ribosomal protein L18 [Bacillota bacterium]HPT33970.1 50S ribosomal protein L18 [Bacillota bacterium]HPZ65013.1 50S ribosomal protein L18 [Bacillota bacterium]